MQTATNTELTHFNGWTLRVRKSTHPAPRFLLLLHGWTGDENSMWVFARDLPTHYWMIAPRAPHVTEPSGYSWRPMQTSEIGRPTRAQLEPAAEALIRLIEAYQASAGVEAQEMDVMGFSQGGVMSSLLTFLYPHRIRKTGILSGFLPDGLDDLVTKQTVAGKSFFIAHGIKDEIVPIDRARTSIKILEQASAQVMYCEDEVGHKVSLPCLHALKQFLAE